MGDERVHFFLLPLLQLTGALAVRTASCCSELHVLHTPNRGNFGFPAASILGVYYLNAAGSYECSDCEVPVSLELVTQGFMGGSRWTFVTHGRQYAVFAASEVACPSEVSLFKYWKSDQYAEGSFMLRCSPVTDACCETLTVIRSPNGGEFGTPPVSILHEFRWSAGAYECIDCEGPVSLQPVNEEWMGGTHWTFVTHGRQYTVYAAESNACPDNGTHWKYWISHQGYIDGQLALQCTKPTVWVATPPAANRSPPRYLSMELPLEGTGSTSSSSGTFDSFRAAANAAAASDHPFGLSYVTLSLLAILVYASCFTCVCCAVIIGYKCD